ncbi:flavin reductase family protein [Kaistella polysaccharea]|uniref:flavin reductase family protein n=1 Tax=Kaistella polysaccharea TaxID=2878534 RepID=UPI001CF45F43|nr:flavin reductase family protein [Kaistella polysaccharea]
MQKEQILTFSKEEILESEQRFRAKLINSVAGIRQVSLIGTKSKDGQENVAIFNSLIHLGSHPPLFGFISRPDSVERDTLENIRETEYYTINYVNETLASHSHQTSARYPKDTSEFEVVGFSPEYVNNCIAPFVKEAEIKIEMKLQQILNLEINNTILVIGSVEAIHIPSTRLSEDGLVKGDGLLLSGGLDAYYKGVFLEQLPYAKP